MNIYVGNLSYNLTEDELRAAFAAFGDVSSSHIIQDRDSGRSKGFGFVEMPNDQAAEKAIHALNETPIGGRPVRVNQAKPKESRPQRRRAY